LNAQNKYLLSAFVKRNRFEFRLGRQGNMVEIKLKSSHWIVDENDNIIIGKGRMEILEHVENTGSINQAAKIMKMSYKAVWSKIKYTEKHLKTKIVRSDRKTGSCLTREGKNLLENYRLLKKKCMIADDKIFSGIFKQKPSKKG
jgi:molybdate transport system regulatory protein